MKEETSPLHLAGKRRRLLAWVIGIGCATLGGFVAGVFTASPPPLPSVQTLNASLSPARPAPPFHEAVETPILGERFGKELEIEAVGGETPAGSEARMVKILSVAGKKLSKPVEMRLNHESASGQKVIAGEASTLIGWEEGGYRPVKSGSSLNQETEDSVELKFERSFALEKVSGP